jgi:hypothetical protein
MKIWFLTLGLVFGEINLIAQTSDTLSYPDVGKPMPELTIRNIKYFPKKEAHISDFKGKWLLLDFWNIQCEACIVSFPYVNEIQKKLGDRVQVMLVGIQDEGRYIEPMYTKFHDRLHLGMPCAFDSVLANRLDIYIAPHSILIDDKGIVQCITISFNLQDIQGFLDGNPPVLPQSYRRMHDTTDGTTEQYGFDHGKPFLINGNGGNDSDFLFRSVLSRWNRNLHRQVIPSSISQDIGSGKFQVLGAPLEWLYNYAYFGHSNWSFFDTGQYGKEYVHPQLEMKDSSKFKFSYKYSKNIYSYSLIMPASACTEQSMKKALQRDLETYFGFESGIETRNFPCWKLLARKGVKEKLSTRGKASYYKQLAFNAGFTAGNFPMQELINWIKSNQQEKIIIDETGITGNIDISLDCIPSDFDDLQNALRENGLDLVRSEIPMRVVLIRDKKDSISWMK